MKIFCFPFCHTVVSSLFSRALLLILFSLSLVCWNIQTTNYQSFPISSLLWLNFVARHIARYVVKVVVEKSFALALTLLMRCDEYWRSAERRAWTTDKLRETGEQASVSFSRENVKTLWHYSAHTHDAGCKSWCVFLTFSTCCFSFVTCNKDFSEKLKSSTTQNARLQWDAVTGWHEISFLSQLIFVISRSHQCITFQCLMYTQRFISPTAVFDFTSRLITENEKTLSPQTSRAHSVVDGRLQTLNE